MASTQQLESRIRSVKKPVSYAFVDSQNLNLSVRDQGWCIDYTRFRRYLADKYNVQKAYMFIGYLPENTQLYNALQSAGFVCVFRPTLKNADGMIKGNCDAELVLQAMIDINEYDKAVIVSGDGDFQCLAKYLHESDKLGVLLIPNRHKFSALLKFDFLKSYHRFVNDLESKVAYKKKSPREDKHSEGTSSIRDSSIVSKNKANVKTRHRKEKR